MPAIRDVQTLYRSGLAAQRRRKARARWIAHEAARGALPADRFEAVLYFADSEVNLYQLRQWYEPMRHLAEQHPVAVVARNVVTADLLSAECPLPVVHKQTVAEIEEWLGTQRVSIVFYVNQNTRNFQMMRFRDPAHVFISHGESDKDYMASNQLKAYDYTFVAGDAAVERISKRLIDFDAEKRLVKIGRPQVDVDYYGPTLPDDGRTVILYAPTWEGDRPSMTYSSLGSHAGPMLDALIATGTHRIVYRPHPRTGAYDPAYKVLHQAIVRKLDTANAADPAAHHMVDTETAFGWHLKAADACVCDISAVAFDWLATGKPLLLTEPASPEAEVDRSGLVGMIETFRASDAANVVELIRSRPAAMGGWTYDAIVKHYFGASSPGGAIAAFTAAATRVISRRHTSMPAIQSPGD
ncbi:CDP-glycerol glycerophosphotransferase family protein [Cellulomonas sp. PhB143]|uniref:CDP-glycerol glycerophosphotransferase family protein n=1 Tax=Cellulomonas sp. PhB143 TaxID=2485186 RepID=UPI000F47E390|nr:CDP-glycerol glycerophosphotransferase family protein [Cellulomonas sp. PhB143]ROS78539.1 CDP-glycerol:poly(glycerophosphate) glycerophosphotransferase [Cellulomonas sp. PhB143]